MEQVSQNNVTIGDFTVHVAVFTALVTFCSIIVGSLVTFFIQLALIRRKEMFDIRAEQRKNRRDWHLRRQVALCDLIALTSEYRELVMKFRPLAILSVQAHPRLDRAKVNSKMEVLKSNADSLVPRMLSCAEAYGEILNLITGLRTYVMSDYVLALVYFHIEDAFELEEERHEDVVNHLGCFISDCRELAKFELTCADELHNMKDNALDFDVPYFTVIGENRALQSLTVKEFADKIRDIEDPFVTVARTEA